MTQSSCLTDYAAFQALWSRNLQAGATDNSRELHQKLIQAYSEPGRCYHTLDHIEGCFELFEDIYDIADNPDALALSIWFHDAIYTPGAKDNEQLSADWFMQVSKNAFEDDLRNRVYELIMFTLHCCGEITDHDARLMVDIDLSSFGMPWEQFVNDSTNVRRELPDISDAEFYPKQCAFSKALLDNPRFFQSDYFFEHYEAQARQNLSDYYQFIEQKLAVGE